MLLNPQATPLPDHKVATVETHHWETRRPLGHIQVTLRVEPHVVVVPCLSDVRSHLLVSEMRDGWKSAQNVSCRERELGPVNLFSMGVGREDVGMGEPAG